MSETINPIWAVGDPRFCGGFPTPRQRVAAALNTAKRCGIVYHAEDERRALEDAIREMCAEARVYLIHHDLPDVAIIVKKIVGGRQAKG